MWAVVFKFFMELLTGDVFRLWAAHKEKEANDAKNKALSLSDRDAVAKLQSDWTRK